MKNLLVIIDVVCLLVTAEGIRIIQDMKTSDEMSQGFDQSLDNETLKPLVKRSESAGENNEAQQCRFLLMLNLEKLITIPGANNIHKYRLEKSKIVGLVSEVMGADLMELGQAKSSMIIDLVETFQLVQKKMLEAVDRYQSQILFDWFLKFISEGWPLFSRINNKELFDYIHFLSKEFDSLTLESEFDNSTEVLVKDFLEELMGMSVQDYVKWYKVENIEQNVFMEKQINLLKKIVRKEGADVTFLVYKLLDQINDKIKCNSERVAKLWQQIYDKHI